MRVLLTTLPAFGHAVTLLALARALTRRGHAVAWAAHPTLRTRCQGPQEAWFDTDEALPPLESGSRVAVLRQYFRHVLPDLADGQLPGVLRAIEAFAPDIVVTDQNALAGSIAPRQLDLPWVPVHNVPILLLRPFRVLPGVERWIDEVVGALQERHGVAPLPWPLRSPYGNLVPTSRAFLGEQAQLQPTDVLLGSLCRVPHEPADSWGPAPRILITLGTLGHYAEGPAFLDAAVAASRSMGSVLVLGVDRPGEAGVQYLPWGPLPALLEQADVVLCHGGQNTVTEALSAGVPLVVAPASYDHPAIALRLEALGVGRTVRFDAPDPVAIEAALRHVLDDALVRQRLAALAPTLTDGSDRAVDHLEAVVAR